MDETLADILAQAAAQTPAESLRNVAQCVIGLTTITRYYNGRGRSRTYSGDIDAIADAARHLAELVLAATPTPAQPADPLPPDLDAAHAEIRRLRFQLAHANNLIAVICDPAFEEAQP